MTHFAANEPGTGDEEGLEHDCSEAFEEIPPFEK